MLSNKIQDALNAQINAELWSAYLYLSMSLHFQAEGRAGVANWFAIQFKEEQAHAQILMNYVNQRGGRVILLRLTQCLRHGLPFLTPSRLPSNTSAR